VALGTTTSGLEFMLEQYKVFNKNKQDIHPYTFSASVPNACPSIIAILTSSRGPCKVFGSACAAANDAIGYGFNIIRNQKINIMFVGGSETPLHPLIIDACSMGGIVSRKEIIAPFDKNRDGTLLGEGAGILILEELGHALNRGATIYAEVTGYGTTCDAYHIVKLLDTGESLRRAIELALQDARIYPEEVDYINAHGTATVPNDKLETMVIKNTFGKHAYKLAVSSTKSMIGHLQGAAGAVEAIATVLAIAEDTCPPTINYQTPDPECDLDYVPNKSRKKEINVALKTNSGFGGINSVLVFKKFRNENN
jgi:3-oxoacyl-[acyl-carrier-protein] synthase II